MISSSSAARSFRAMFDFAVFVQAFDDKKITSTPQETIPVVLIFEININ